MKKPDFKDLKKLIKAINDTNDAFKSIYAEKDSQENRIKAICKRMASEKARESLGEFSVEELKNAKVGIRVAALQEAGYTDLGKIAKATDYDIRNIEGIGEKQIEAIRHIITEFANSLSSRVSIVLDANDPELITEMYRYLKSEDVRRDAQEPAKNLDLYAAKVASSGIILGGFGWLFSGNDKKTRTINMVAEIYEFCNSDFFEKLLGLIDRYHCAINSLSEDAVQAFTLNGADFYALLEKLGSGSGNRPFIYDSIPGQLAEEISSMQLSQKTFRGNLRVYQEFGAKYILHQSKVLLGDEMGLGKTIQAIAAMAHIQETTDGLCHFLVVCPASVLVNWSKELSKFSNIDAYILHGQTLDDAFDRWRDHGGAAITNYESMGKIVDRIDNHMTLEMLVIDEAHYIKNPDAKRTMYIRRLDNESKRILMMTGTPLENRVDEMCNLIDFVRPDMTKEVRGMAHLSHVPEFREALSPVYLRRTRTQVLKELPPIDEKQEWCEMSFDDQKAYTAAVMNRNFQYMRRVGFLQENIKTSAKTCRLLELCNEAKVEGRKVVVYSFFRDTISKVAAILGDKCVGVISGDTPVAHRQDIVDRFGEAKDGSILLCQIIAGGVGLNIQAASMVIFCEPQIKPSLTSQALSRVYRMGQVRNVTVYHLLCPETIDEEMMLVLEQKQNEFDNYAGESVLAGAFDNLMDKEWISDVIEKESKKYLPAVL